MQRAAEEALQEGLFQYERQNNRLEFRGAEANLTQAIAKIDAGRKSDTDRKSDADKKSGDRRPSWQVALLAARLPLYDVHWTPAVVVNIAGNKKGTTWYVGLADGRLVPLSLDSQAQRKIRLNDVVLVRVSGGKGRSARADLRVRPAVQGATIVLENKTGRILAMAGGFSFPLSQLNRVTQAARQPGSTIKPLTYLAALGKGLQPDTLVSDGEITLHAIGSRGRHVRGHEDDDWTPKNYDGGGGGVLTMRSALENSRNRATVHLLDGGIERDPEQSLNRVCDLAVEALIYRECQHFYPVILGAQPVRPVDLAAFYATIANEGTRPSPFTVESIERNGQLIYRHQPMPVSIRSVDPAAFYQLKSMLQGVVARGTARSISHLSPYVAGKTGTTDDENDAWFIGFTNDVTVAVWLGYDNAPGGKRRTLGSGSTGGAVAVPVFEPIVEAAWTNVAQRRALAPPSPQAKQQLACSGTSEEPRDRRRRSKASAGAITECFRVDRRGQIIDTKYRLVSQGSATAREETPRGDRPAYAFDTQGRWPFAWPNTQQWRPHYGFDWRGHRPRFHWRRF
jgi:membrane carboxypeptidase/penicillin-binding protein